jgi:hypothetical protein
METWMAGERIEMRAQAAAGRWRHRTLPLGLLLMILAPAPVADAATLTVGTGKQYRTVAGAVAAARDGDVIQVQAGTYTNDFAIVGKKVSIVGVGGMARLVATTAIGNGKAILVTTTDVTLDHVEFAGARVADRNGAGIRYEGGKLIVRKCYFHDNENGILANASATGTISIAGSEFARRYHDVPRGQVAALGGKHGAGAGCRRGRGGPDGHRAEQGELVAGGA